MKGVEEDKVFFFFFFKSFYSRALLTVGIFPLSVILWPSSFLSEHKTRQTTRSSYSKQTELGSAGGVFGDDERREKEAPCCISEMLLPPPSFIFSAMMQEWTRHKNKTRKTHTNQHRKKERQSDMMTHHPIELLNNSSLNAPSKGVLALIYRNTTPLASACVPVIMQRPTRRLWAKSIRDVAPSSG